MNKQMLAGILAAHGDTQATLAAILGLSLSRINAKINANRAQFTQAEITEIKNHYGLTANEVDNIFFAS